MSRKNGEIIVGGREMVASKGLSAIKKRYALPYYDIEGFRTDTGESPKIKAMGLDPNSIRYTSRLYKILSDVLTGVLTGNGRDETLEKVKQFKEEFMLRPMGERIPRRANNMTKSQAMEERLGKANMPRHVRASMNWNRLRKMNSDRYSTEIKDGAKVIVCKLKANLRIYKCCLSQQMKHICPIGLKNCPSDDGAMESTVIDSKINNLLEVLEWIQR